MTFLKKRADFLALRRGLQAHTPGFLLVKRDRRDADPTIRVGFTTTKKLGGAVIRNRIRRRLREVARATFPKSAQAGCDYVLIARHAAYDRAHEDLLDDVKRGLLRLARKPT